MRTVVLSHVAQVALDEAVADGAFHRVGDAWMGLEWRLCRRPEDGVLMGPGLYIFHQDGFPGLEIPDIVVVYRFTSDLVEVVALRCTF